MRIRQGFVSNSSSASFIVIWDKNKEMIQNGEYYSQDVGLHKVLEDLFEFADPKCVDEIEALTVETVGKQYKTCFWTSMFNGVDDFGGAAIRLVGATAIKGQLIDTKVVEHE